MTWQPSPTYSLAPRAPTTEDVAALAEWLNGNPPLAQGPLVRTLESQFAAKVGARQAVFVGSSGAASALAWLLPITVGRADVAANPKVVVPAVTAAESVIPAILFGYEPVLCDADEKTWGLDPEHLRRICEKHSPLIVMMPHVLGVPCNADEIVALRDELGFMLIEDASDAFGSAPVGQGDLRIYSAGAGHQVSTVEGGFVCTDGEGDDIRDDTLRMLRASGCAIDSPADTRASLAKGADVEKFYESTTSYVPGLSARGTEIQAFLGLEQLKRIDAATDIRRLNHVAYRSRFAGAAGFRVQAAGSSATPTIASVGFGVLAASAGHRKRVVEALEAKKIETRPILCVARQLVWSAYYESRYQRKVADRPMANAIHACGFVLPNHEGLEKADVEYIADTVLAVKP